MILCLTEVKYENALKNKEIHEQTDADGVIFTTWKKKSVEHTKEDARRIEEKWRMGWQSAAIPDIGIATL